MAGIRWQPEDSDVVLPRPPPSSSTVAGGGDLVSDDDRSVAADSWSIKSEYGSTLDDEQRHVDASEVLYGASFRAASDYSSDKDEPDVHEVESSMLGLQSYWDASYAEDLANYQEHGQAGEIWFCDLTGTDYSEGAIELARNIASRDGFPNINFLVDDVLETKLDRKYRLVIDKGTLDAIGLHPDGPLKRIMYWESVMNLVAPGGMVVITSCNNTKDELIQEVDSFNQRNIVSQNLEREGGTEQAVFKYIDHIRTYPTIMLGGVDGSRVSTIAFLRN